MSITIKDQLGLETDGSVDMPYRGYNIQLRAARIIIWTPEGNPLDLDLAPSIEGLVEARNVIDSTISTEWK